LDDETFLADFLEGRVPPAEFHHRDHVRLAWAAVRREGPASAEETVASGIRHFAVAHGQANRYHDTLTRFWVRLVAHVADARPGATFDSAMSDFPLLLEKETPLRHWRRETLFSEPARAGWTEPDLLPLPF
jgi:hypothetical protein